MYQYYDNINILYLPIGMHPLTFHTYQLAHTNIVITLVFPTYKVAYTHSHQYYDCISILLINWHALISIPYLPIGIHQYCDCINIPYLPPGKNYSIVITLTFPTYQVARTH